MGDKIYKKEFITMLATEVGMPQSRVEEVLNKAFQLVIDLTRKGNEVVFSGFGKFYPYQTKRKVAFNPRKGEKIFITNPKTKIKFRQSHTIEF